MVPVEEACEEHSVAALYQDAEVAPGLARLTTEIRGVTNGVLVEYSYEMLAEAK